MPRTKPVVEQIEDAAEERTEFGPIDPDRLIPSGSTLFNLACSDNPFGAYLMGTIANEIGDRSSGKTLKYFNMLAECCRDRRFDGYRLFHDDPEHGYQFDTTRMFGPAVEERVEAPYTDDEGEPCGSRTIEQFKASIKGLLAEGQPFIYALDSFDALTSDAQLSKSQKKQDGESGVKGSYNLDATKGLSEMFKEITAEIDDTDSFLLIISQVRENIDAAKFAPKFRRNGGRALGHYCSIETWLALVGQIQREINKKKYTIGVNCQPRITKNRLTGKMRNGQFPIYYEYGIDDIESCVNYLLQQKWWTGKRDNFNAKGLRLSGSVDEVCRAIEDRGLEERLQEITGECWANIEERLKRNRKPRYS